MFPDCRRGGIGQGNLHTRNRAMFENIAARASKRNGIIAIGAVVVVVAILIWIAM